jgi:hypothetical protein
VLRDGPAGHVFGGVGLLPGGDIVVADSTVHDPTRVLRFDADGGSMRDLAVGGDLVSPIGIAVDRAGTILVADQGRRVVAIDPGSGAQAVVSLGGSLMAPIGLAVR